MSHDPGMYLTLTIKSVCLPAEGITPRTVRIFDHICHLFIYLLLICIFDDAVCCSEQCKYRETYFRIMIGTVLL